MTKPGKSSKAEFKWHNLGTWFGGEEEALDKSATGRKSKGVKQDAEEEEKEDRLH